MGRLSVFDHPLLLGFEEVERTVDPLTISAGNGHPPYNIEQTGPGSSNNAAPGCDSRDSIAHDL